MINTLIVSIVLNLILGYALYYLLFKKGPRSASQAVLEEKNAKLNEEINRIRKEKDELEKKIISNSKDIKGVRDSITPLGKLRSMVNRSNKQ